LKLNNEGNKILLEVEERMPVISIDEIREIITEYCRQINASEYVIRNAVLDHTTHFADPHIEIYNEEYHFVSVERGKEIFRKTTKELDELLYWIMEGITSGMASTHAALQKLPNGGFFEERKEKQLELLSQINEEFYIKKKNESI
jgi:hypothetical protein